MIEEPGADAAAQARAREPGAEGPASTDRSLADAMPQIVWVAGPEGQTEYVNRRLSEYTGLPPGERPDWSSGVHPDDLPSVRMLWARAHAAGERCEMVYRLRRADPARDLAALAA
jgi:PAS domain-containing protein